jgi:DNA-binding transcriptional LysR family regulator
LARRYIREGWLLPQCSVEYDGLFLYYPRHASLAPKLRVFIEAAKTVLRQQRSIRWPRAFDWASVIAI